MEMTDEVRSQSGLKIHAVQGKEGGKAMLEAVKKYFALCESFSEDEEAFREILHPDMEQTEFPNLLTERVTVSDYATLLSRVPKGKLLLQSQTFDLQRAFEAGDALIAEVIWTGTVGTDLGSFRQGQELKAYFCCVFEFRDGKIYRQRNYDCFERFDVNA